MKKSRELFAARKEAFDGFEVRERDRMLCESPRARDTRERPWPEPFLLFLTLLGFGNNKVQDVKPIEPKAPSGGCGDLRTFDWTSLARRAINVVAARCLRLRPIINLLSFSARAGSRW